MIYYNSSIHFLWFFFSRKNQIITHMQINCQQGTRKNNDHNLLLLLFKHKHPRLVKHQFSLSLSGSPYHLYFDFKEQKVTTSAEVDILVQFILVLISYPNTVLIHRLFLYPNAIVLLTLQTGHRITYKQWKPSKSRLYHPRYHR